MDKTNLHDEKMWVVDIKTNRAEQVLHPGVVGIDSIDEVLVPATDYNLTERDQNFWLQTIFLYTNSKDLLIRVVNSNLSCDGDLIVCFKPKRTLAFVGVVKGNRHRGFGDTTLTIFVDQVLEVGGSHLSNE